MLTSGLLLTSLSSVYETKEFTRDPSGLVVILLIKY